MWQQTLNGFLPTKLSPHFTGPYEVIKQEKNDVIARHLATGAIKVMHVTRLKLYHGNKDIGRQIAEVDVDQYRVTRILAWKGVPTERV